MSAKICIVSSCGGHLTEVRSLLPAYRELAHFYVLNDKALLPADMQDKTCFIAHSERDWKFFLNLWEALVILRRERPTLILSTGAGPVVPFALIGRLFFSVHVVFIETFTRVVKPSMTARLMYWLAQDFYIQRESLHCYFPKAKYFGALL